jgi:hypothetical protein
MYKNVFQFINLYFIFCSAQGYYCIVILTVDFPDVGYLHSHFPSKSLSTKPKKTEKPSTHLLTQPSAQLVDWQCMLACLVKVLS